MFQKKQGQRKYKTLKSLRKVWVREIYHQRERKGACNMLFQELCFTDKELHFGYHKVHYFKRRSYCGRSQRERKKYMIEEIESYLRTCILQFCFFLNVEAIRILKFDIFQRFKISSNSLKSSRKFADSYAFVYFENISQTGKKR